MVKIRTVKKWLNNLKKNQIVRRKGKTYPFFYLHINTENHRRQYVGKCLTSGQCSWEPISFSKKELLATDWILIEE